MSRDIEEIARHRASSEIPPLATKKASRGSGWNRIKSLLTLKWTAERNGRVDIDDLSDHILKDIGMLDEKRKTSAFCGFIASHGSMDGIFR